MRRRPSFSSLVAVLVIAGFGAAALAAVPPGEKKRVLFFSKSSGFQHSVIKVVDGQPSDVEKVLTELGEKHGYEFTCTKDGSIFTKAGLAAFDAVFFYTTGDLTDPGNDGKPPMPKDGRQVLIDFVSSGKGFVAAHSATDTFHLRPKTDRFQNDPAPDPYIRLLGGEFITHGSQQSARMRVADPNFPGMNVAGAGFEMVEEWYSLKNFAKDLHVLLVQETGTMTGNAKGNPYARPPYPATWARQEGKGRVFYTSMGHKPDTWTNPLFQQILVGGLDWAVGRVEADVTPNIDTVTPGARTLPPAGPAPVEAAKPAPPATTTVRVDLAQGKPATASGSQGGTRPNTPDHAVDGDTASYWAAKELTFPQWLQIDLGAPSHVLGSEIQWQTNKGAWFYRLEGSSDGKTWQMLVDGSANTRASVKVEDRFEAKEIRLVRLTLLGIAGSPHVRPAVSELKIWGEGVATESAAASAPQKEAKLLAEMKIPPGYSATIFAAPPAVNYPTFLSAAPDGTLYVACDKNGASGRELHRGRIVRLRDLDGDGRAEEVRPFVKDLDTPRGILWDHDRLYVLHPPTLSAFIDRDGDGVADEEKVLVKNIGWSFKDRSGDHASNGIELGIDGWLYCAIGDFGFFDAEGIDGRKAQLRGGGVVRVRPDGTGLEIYTRGTRNIYRAAVDPLLNLFARDNNNDGTWGVVLHHFTGLDDHGYPSRFRNFADEVVPPLADYVSGSGSGALYLQEPGFPKGAGDALYTADWGKSFIYRHPLQPRGATFTAGQEEFIGIPRITDFNVDASSRLYAASWRGAIFSYAGEDVGYIARIAPKGYRPEPLPDFEKLSPAELVKLLASPSQKRRVEAQRALLRRGVDAATGEALLLLAEKAPRLATQVAAIFTLKQAWGARATKPLTALVHGHSKIEAFVIRALADRVDELEGVPEPLLKSGLDGDARAQVEAVRAIARFGKPEGASLLASRLGSEPTLEPLVEQGLITLRGTKECFQILDAPNTPEKMRAGALHVLQRFHEPAVVDGLLERLQKETAAPRRRGLLTALCRLHFREAEWKGAGWGLSPDTTGPYFQPETWSATPKIAAALTKEMQQAKGDEAAFLVGEFNRHQIQSDDAVHAIVALALQNPKHVPTAVDQLARSPKLPPESVPLLVRAAADAHASDEVRGSAVAALAKTESPEGCVAALQVFATFEQKPKAEKSRSRPFKRAREAFFTAPALPKYEPLLIAEAAKLTPGTSAWADAALLKIPTATAKAAIAAGWAAAPRRVQIVEAIGLAADRLSAGRVLQALGDTDPAVVAAARETAKKLRLDSNAKPGPAAPLIGTLPLERVIAAVKKIKGDPELGEQLFTQQGCIACHTVTADEPPKLGPFLASTAGVYQRGELAEMVLNPSKSLAQGYETQHLVMKDGKEYLGFIRGEDKERITLRDMALQEVQIPTAQVVRHEQLDVSAMPPGLVAGLNEKEFAALLAYLESLAKH